MKLNITLIIISIFFGCSCNQSNTIDNSEIRAIQNAKKVNELAIKNGLDTNKVHFDFEDKELTEKEWDELDDFFHQQGLIAKKNADMFQYNSENLKVIKELTSFFPHDNKTIEEIDLFLEISESIKYRKGKKLEDLYLSIKKYPNVFSEELISDLEKKIYQ